MALVVTPSTVFGSQPGPIPTTDLDQVFAQFTSAIESGATFTNYIADLGGVNAVSLTYPTGQVMTYANGLTLTFIAADTNTGATTVSVDGQTAVPIVQQGGAAIPAGDIVASGIYVIVYSSFVSGFVLINGTATGNYLPLSGGTLTGSLVIGGAAYTPSVNLGSSLSGAVTVNAALSDEFYGTLTGNITGLTISNMQDGQSVSVLWKQDATGSRTLAYTTTVHWPNNTAQALTTGIANCWDIATYKMLNGVISANYLKGFQ